jgi:hypothetical protein
MRPTISQILMAQSVVSKELLDGGAKGTHSGNLSKFKGLLLAVLLL